MSDKNQVWETIETESGPLRIRTTTIVEEWDDEDNSNLELLRKVREELELEENNGKLPKFNDKKDRLKRMEGDKLHVTYANHI